MNEPQNERVLIILLPCIAILTAGCILAPRFLYFAHEAVIYEEDTLPITTEALPKESSLPITAAPSATSNTPLPSPTETAAPTETPAPMTVTKTVLSASSTERDLYVKVKDENGNTINGERFTLSFD